MYALPVHPETFLARTPNDIAGVFTTASPRTKSEIICNFAALISLGSQVERPSALMDWLDREASAIALMWTSLGVEPQNTASGDVFNDKLEILVNSLRAGIDAALQPNNPPAANLTSGQQVGIDAALSQRQTAAPAKAASKSESFVERRDRFQKIAVKAIRTDPDCCKGIDTVIQKCLEIHPELDETPKSMRLFFRNGLSRAKDAPKDRLSLRDLKIMAGFVRRRRPAHRQTQPDVERLSDSEAPSASSAGNGAEAAAAARPVAVVAAAAAASIVSSPSLLLSAKAATPAPEAEGAEAAPAAVDTAQGGPESERTDAGAAAAEALEAPSASSAGERAASTAPSPSLPHSAEADAATTAPAPAPASAPAAAAEAAAAATAAAAAAAALEASTATFAGDGAEAAAAASTTRAGGCEGGGALSVLPPARASLPLSASAEDAVPAPASAASAASAATAVVASSAQGGEEGEGSGDWAEEAEGWAATTAAAAEAAAGHTAQGGQESERTEAEAAAAGMAAAAASAQGGEEGERSGDRAEEAERAGAAGAATAEAVVVVVVAAAATASEGGVRGGTRDGEGKLEDGLVDVVSADGGSQQVLPGVNLQMKNSLGDISLASQSMMSASRLMSLRVRAAVLNTLGLQRPEILGAIPHEEGQNEGQGLKRVRSNGGLKLGVTHSNGQALFPPHVLDKAKDEHQAFISLMQSPNLVPLNEFYAKLNALFNKVDRLGSSSGSKRRRRNSLAEFSAKAMFLQRELDRELARRAASVCFGCGLQAVMYGCGCGEGYCAACYQPSPTGQEQFRVACHRCVQDKGSTDKIAVLKMGCDRCLACGKGQGMNCNECGSPFCQFCAGIGADEPWGNTSFTCRSCIGPKIHDEDRRLHANKYEKVLPKSKKVFNPAELKAADRLCDLFWRWSRCGLRELADGLIPILFKTHSLQHGNGHSLTPRQIQAAINHKSASLQHVEQSIASAADACFYASRPLESCVPAARRGDAAAPSIGFDGQQIKLGYMITWDESGPHVLESIVPWLAGHTEKRFSVHLIVLLTGVLMEQQLSSLSAAIQVVSIPTASSNIEAICLIQLLGLDIMVDTGCGMLHTSRPASTDRECLKYVDGLARIRVCAGIWLAGRMPPSLGDYVVLDDEMEKQCSGGSRKQFATVLKVGMAFPFDVRAVRQAIAASPRPKADLGIPQGFMFVHVHELSLVTAETMQCFLTILYYAPGSSLIMYGQPMWAQLHLRALATAFAADGRLSLDTETRLIFRPWPDTTESRVHLLRHADLLLAHPGAGSVSPPNAAFQALAAGVPVLTMSNGKGFFNAAIRNALRYTGLHNTLLATNESDFIERAVHAGNRRMNNDGIKTHLQQLAEKKQGLFNEERAVQEWEFVLNAVFTRDMGKNKAAEGFDGSNVTSFGPPSPYSPDAMLQGKVSSGPGAERLRILNAIQVRKPARAPKEDIRQAQMDSLLEAVQDRGGGGFQVAGIGGHSWAVSFFQKDHSPMAVQSSGLVLLVEMEARPLERIHNASLFRYAWNVMDRRRKPFDPHVVRVVDFWAPGIALAVSYADPEGMCLVAMVCEQLLTPYHFKPLQDSSDNWRRTGVLDEAMRLNSRDLLWAVNEMHRGRLTHLDIKSNNIMRNSEDKPVFIDLGSGVRFSLHHCPATAMRQQTSKCARFAAPAPTTDLEGGASGETRVQKPELDRIKKSLVWRRAKGSQDSANLNQSVVAKHATQSAKASRVSRLNANFSQPAALRPSLISDSVIKSTMRELASKGATLAMLGDGTVGFSLAASNVSASEGAGSKRRAIREPTSAAAPLRFEDGCRRDALGAMRTLLTMVRPIDAMSTAAWNRQALNAAESAQAMRVFILGGLEKGVQPQQPEAFNRLVKFLCYGLSHPDKMKALQTDEWTTTPVHPPAIERAVHDGSGITVQGGPMSEIPICPFPGMILKPVVLKLQAGMGTGAYALHAYSPGELVTFYYGPPVLWTEIDKVPPERYFLSVVIRWLYCDGSFNTTRTLEYIAGMRAIGACLNGAAQGKANCSFLRLKATRDTSGNLWIPICACKEIKTGEPLLLTYDHEAAIAGDYNFKPRRD